VVVDCWLLVVEVLIVALAVIVAIAAQGFKWANS
jgi:hypothetical protein